MINSGIWKLCLNCDSNCCVWLEKVQYKLFLSKKEKKRLGENIKFPCHFLTKNKLCSVHKHRPIDCRFWPFDIYMKNDKFYWAYYNSVECPIIKTITDKEIESILKNFESRLIPEFRDYLRPYSQFQLKKFIKFFGKPTIIREIALFN